MLSIKLSIISGRLLNFLKTASVLGISGVLEMISDSTKTSVWRLVIGNQNRKTPVS